MTRHLRQTFTSMERVAGLHEGIPMTECGIELMDLPAGDMIAGDRADCPACLNQHPEPVVLVNEEWLRRQPIHLSAGEKTACGVHPRWQVLVTTTEAVLVTCQECKRK